MAPTPVFGLAGWSGAGKTTLAEKLIAELRMRGIRLATIKHAHHEFDADSPGKDSWRHRQAGAGQVLVSSAFRSAHFVEHEAGEPPLETLLERLLPCDLVMIEGYKKEPFAKVEIWREALGKPPLFKNDRHIFAVASDMAVADCPLPLLDLNDSAAIADAVLHHLGLDKR